MLLSEQLGDPTALSQIAVMGRKGEILRIHVGDHVRDYRGLLGRIRQVTPEADCICALAVLVDAICVIFVLSMTLALQVSRHVER